MVVLKHFRHETVHTLRSSCRRVVDSAEKIITIMSIKLYITGGTIDKEYSPINGELVFIKTHLLEMLEQAKNKVDIEPEVLMLKDSLDMSDNDRAIILKKCETAKEEKILITHGTDTIVETAQVLGKNILNKTIVLTGAMIPFSFGNSDALFNLGFAIGAVQFLPAGVFVAMNGKIFPWDNVRKNKDIGVFENIQ